MHPYFGIEKWERANTLRLLAVYRREMQERVFAAFTTIEDEAERVAEEEFQRLASAHASDDGRADILADRARDKGVDHFMDLEFVAAGVTNLMTAGLYHTFWETRVRDWLLRRADLFRLSNAHRERVLRGDFGAVAKVLGDLGWHLEGHDFFADLDELRLVANTVKHARGDSANRLFERNRRLFCPFDRMGEDEMIASYVPDGENLRVTEADFERYAEAVERFWRALPVAASPWD
jgi:hypothetical protein